MDVLLKHQYERYRMTFLCLVSLGLPLELVMDIWEIDNKNTQK
jgi:hypothetical protein